MTQLAVPKTLTTDIRNGALPSVSFIDPRYIDVPPAWAANDDLPPANVCRGQQLVREIYQLLLEDPATWKRTLLVVTYDEHGGFFDHKAPAGLASSDNPQPQPRVHPDGPDHLGVRVPAFLVSPWINSGTVCTSLFDHTSLIKTILDRFAPADFPVADVFGQRAAQANGLLSELKRPAARNDTPQAPRIECDDPIGSPGAALGLERDDFHTGMRLLGIPRRYRGRLVV